MLVRKNLLFSLPIIAINLVTALGGFALMWIIGQIGDGGVAAGGLIYSTFGLMISLIFSFAIPVGIFASHAVGSGNKNKVGPAFQASLLIIAIIAVIICIPLLNIEKLYTFFHQPVEARVIAAQFFHGYVIALIPYGFNLAITQVICGGSKPRTGLYLALIQFSLITPLAYWFTFGGWGIPAMGAFGTALGAAVGSMIRLIGSIIYLEKSSQFKCFRLFQFNWITLKQQLKPIFHMGVPICTQRFGEISALSVITLLIGTIGIIELASFQVALQFSFIAIMVAFGFTQAAGILSGQAIGAGDPIKARQQTFCSLGLSTVTTLCFSLFFVLFPHTLIDSFVHAEHGQGMHIKNLAATMLGIIAIAQLFDGARNVFTGALRGYKDTRIPMYLTLFSFWGIGIPSAYLILKLTHWGAPGLVVGFSLGMIVGLILITLRFMKKQRQCIRALDAA